jgi:hypothetical protein
MRNASDKHCRENQNTRFMLNNFFSENRNVHEIMWKKLYSRQATDDNMAHAHCMLDIKGYKNTHSEYVTFIAFPLHQ